MLDVIHYIFEEDMAAASGEQAEARSNVRTILYRSFYEREYQYKSNSNSGSVGSYNSGPTYADGSPIEPMEDLVPFDPLEQAKPTKPYVPPTDFNPESSMPFGTNLDAPLG
jgi:hypothetical protein